MNGVRKMEIRFPMSEHIADISDVENLNGPARRAIYLFPSSMSMVMTVQNDGHGEIARLEKAPDSQRYSIEGYNVVGESVPYASGDDIDYLLAQIGVTP